MGPVIRNVLPLLALVLLGSERVHIVEGRELAVTPPPVAIEVVESLDEVFTNQVERGEVDVLQFSDRPIFIVDFARHDTMTWALQRISDFEEHRRRRGRVVAAELVVPERALAGHDLRLETIPAFVAAAARAGIDLTREERGLVTQLLAAGLLEREGASLRATQPAVVLGITHGVEFGAQGDDLMVRRGRGRGRVTSHELQHGLHLTDPAYFAAVADVWGRLSARERGVFVTWLARKGYDPAHTEQIQSELVAYVHTIGRTDFYQLLETDALAGRLSPAEQEVLRGIGPLNGHLWGRLPAPYDALHDDVVRRVLARRESDSEVTAGPCRRSVPCLE